MKLRTKVLPECYISLPLSLLYPNAREVTALVPPHLATLESHE